VVLPAVSFAEKDGTFTNAERRIQRVRPGVTAPGEAQSDYAILSQLGAKLGASVSFTGPAAVFAALAKTLPAYAGIEFDAIGAEGTVWGGETLPVTCRKLAPAGGGKAVEARFQLVTGSALYHSGTTSTRAKGPLSVVPEAYVEFGREDAAELKLQDGDLMTLTANGIAVKLKAKVGRRLPKGVLFAPNHFAGTGLNRLYKGEAAVAVEVGK